MVIGCLSSGVYNPKRRRCFLNVIMMLCRKQPEKMETPVSLAPSVALLKCVFCGSGPRGFFFSVCFWCFPHDDLVLQPCIWKPAASCSSFPEDHECPSPGMMMAARGQGGR